MTAPHEDGMWALLAANLPLRPDKIACIDPDRRISYAGLAQEAGRVADWLSACNIKAGDRVIVQIRKGIDEVAAMFGIWKMGGVVVNVNSHWTPAQLAYVAKDCRAAAAIMTPQAKAAQAQLAQDRIGQHGAPALGATLPCLVQGSSANANAGGDPWGSLPADHGAAAAMVDPESLAMIIYTSGSTGLPKGVMLSHRNIRIGAVSVAAYLKLDHSDRLLSVLPYSFDAGLNQLTTMMLTGGTVVHQALSMPAEVIRMAQAEEVTGIAGVPPLWGPIVRLLEHAPRQLPHLRRITNTGGKIAPNILELMPKVFPAVDIYLMYGLTEAFRSTYLPPERFQAKMGSIGQQIPNAQVFVIKSGEGIAQAGEQGELVHAGPLVSMGYWERPELSAAKIRPCPELAHLLGDQPVVWSGDLVRVDADGDLWFVSRMDDMIKTMGFRLSPTEVEDLIAQSGMVGDVVAYGVEDAEKGQAVQIAVTLLGPADLQTLHGYAKRQLAHYMQPRHIHCWDGPMPRTASGKLDRPAIIAAARAASIPSATDTPSPTEGQAPRHAAHS